MSGGLAAFASDVLDGTLPDELANLIRRPGFREWADKVLAARGCAKPVRLAGTSAVVNGHVSYTKVAEYQRRGLVHFHAVVRLDGPDGPTTLPPVGIGHETLTAAVRHAVATVTVATPNNLASGARTLSWGEQVDAAPITTRAAGRSTGRTGRTSGARRSRRPGSRRASGSGTCATTSRPC